MTTDAGHQAAPWQVVFSHRGPGAAPLRLVGIARQVWCPVCGHRLFVDVAAATCPPHELGGRTACPGTGRPFNDHPPAVTALPVQPGPPPTGTVPERRERATKAAPVESLDSVRCPVTCPACHTTLDVDPATLLFPAHRVTQGGPCATSGEPAVTWVDAAVLAGLGLTRVSAWTRVTAALPRRDRPGHRQQVPIVTEPMTAPASVARTRAEEFLPVRLGRVTGTPDPLPPPRTDRLRGTSVWAWSGGAPGSGRRR